MRFMFDGEPLDYITPLNKGVTGETSSEVCTDSEWSQNRERCASLKYIVTILDR